MTLSELREALSALDAKDLTVSPAGRFVVDVALGERHQKVRVQANAPWFRLESRICTADRATTRLSVGELTSWILAFNRDQEFLTLARDRKGYLVGRLDLTTDVPVEEVVALLRRLAAECDRAEVRMTGEDH